MIVLRAEGPTTDLIDRLTRDAAAAGAAVLVLDAGSDEARSVEGVHRLRLDPLPEAAAALAMPVALQPTAMILARRAGIEPGQALHASKVTREQ